MTMERHLSIRCARNPTPETLSPGSGFVPSQLTILNECYDRDLGALDDVERMIVCRFTTLPSP